jgi:hypothetical protein
MPSQNPKPGFILSRYADLPKIEHPKNSDHFMIKALDLEKCESPSQKNNTPKKPTRAALKSGRGARERFMLRFWRARNCGWK